MWMLAGCAVGNGEGELTGTVHVADCDLDGDFSLKPDFFAAEPFNDSLEIRIQHGSDWQVYSNGLLIFVHDATTLAAEHLNEPLDLSSPDTGIDVTFYLNETCPADRFDIPVSMTVQTGTLTFTEIYAPELSKKHVKTEAVLTNAHFEDAAQPENRNADVAGSFSFLYVRGRPGQRFP